MTDQQLIEEYFAAWGEHDGVAVQSLFTDDGAYSDPTTGGPLVGEEIAAHVQGLCDVFPDLRLELISQRPASVGAIAAPWLWFGTQYGALGDIEPTGKSVTMFGCSFLTVAEGRLQSVLAVFDPDHLLGQLN